MKKSFKLFDEISRRLKSYCTLVQGGPYGNATSGEIAECNIYTLDIDPSIYIKIKATERSFYVSVYIEDSYKEKEWKSIPSVDTAMNCIYRFVKIYR